MRLDWGNYALPKAAFAVAIGVAMYFMIHPFLWPFLWIPVAAAIAWRGDWGARVVALSMSIDEAIEAAGPRIGLFPHLYDTTQSRTGVLTVDSLTFVLVLVVAIRSRRWWPSWTAAFKALIILSHLIFMARRDAIQPWAYVSSVVIFSWFEYILLAFVAFDLCVRPRSAPRPKATTVAALLVGLLCCLPLLPTLRGGDPPGFGVAQVIGLLILVSAFAFTERRASHV